MGIFSSDWRTYLVTVASGHNCTRSLGKNWVQPVITAIAVSTRPSTCWSFAQPVWRNVKPSLDGGDLSLPIVICSMAGNDSYFDAVKTFCVEVRWRRRRRRHGRTTNIWTQFAASEPVIGGVLTSTSCRRVTVDGRDGFSPLSVWVASREEVTYVCVCRLNWVSSTLRCPRIADRRWEGPGRIKTAAPRSLLAQSGTPCDISLSDQVLLKKRTFFKLYRENEYWARYRSLINLPKNEKISDSTNQLHKIVHTKTQRKISTTVSPL